MNNLRPLLILFSFFTSTVAVQAQQMAFHTSSDTSQIILEVETNKKEGKFLFDNAAELSVIFLENKEDLENFKVVKETFVTDAQGKRKDAFIVTKVKLRIKKLEIKEKATFLAIIGAPKQLEEIGVRGILGANFVNNYDWKINFKDLLISTIKIDHSIPEDEYYRFNYFFNDRNIASTVLSDSLSTDTFQLDFGYNQNIHVSSEKWVSNADFVKVGVRMSVSDDEVDTTLIEIKPLVIFSNSFCVRDMLFYHSPKSNKNLIGVSFFNNFDVVLVRNSIKEICLRKRASSSQSLESIVIYNQQIMAITRAANDLSKPKINIGDEVSAKEFRELNNEIAIPNCTYDFKCLQ